MGWHCSTLVRALKALVTPLAFAAVPPDRFLPVVVFVISERFRGGGGPSVRSIPAEMTNDLAAFR